MNAGVESKIFRVLYTLLFYFIYSISHVAFFIITVIQTALVVFTDEPSDTLLAFGGSFSVYVKQIGLYLSYKTEQKPFPFSDWPDSNPPA